MGFPKEMHAGGATICMVTHNPDYARHAARSIDVFDGRGVDETRATSGSKDASAGTPP